MDLLIGWDGGRKCKAPDL